jgi:hypothetical protein
MTDGSFSKGGRSARTLYGPRAMLVCGYAPEEQEVLTKFLDSIHLRNLPLIFASDEDGDTLLGELVTRPDQTGRDGSGVLERAIILSGITENELQRALSAYHGLDLPRPLWATLTPYSKAWRLRDLLKELKKERAATER